MKSDEAIAFLSAFKHEKAKVLVREMMINNYADAIMEHHPQSNDLQKDKILESCSSLCRTLFSEIEEIQDDPELLLPLLVRLSRNYQPQAPFWFKEFSVAYEWYKHKHKLKIKAAQLLPYLQGETYCDIGCGGGDLAAYLKQNNPRFKSYTGIDVLDWRTGSLKNEIIFQMLDFSIPGTRSTKQFDMATCIAVLHHVGHTDESRQIFLENIRSALTIDGRLLIEEDVVLPQEEIKLYNKYERQIIRRSKEQSFFSDFLALTREEQYSSLTIIDLLANFLVVGVQNMAFPFGFKSIEDWKVLFTKSGYFIEDVEILGFTEGMFNRSSHVFFILRPA